jgi:hypothetical protein
MKSRWIAPLLFLVLLSLGLTAADKKQAPEGDIPDDYKEDAAPVPAPSPTVKPTPSATQSTTPKKSDSSKVIIIHKPMPSPSWGKVIQYHREISQSPSEKNREIMHEFLFQDDQGVIRTAIYHENASGDGYWEVWVWDQ